MKKYICAAVGLLLFACASRQQTASIASFGVFEVQDCPDGGICTLVLHKNTKMVVIGETLSDRSYELFPDKESNVLIYTYTKNVPKGIQDASYREELILEVDQKGKLVNRANESAVLFGRFCYCKGFTGYYFPDTIDADHDFKDHVHRYKIAFSIKDVPQFLKVVHFTLK